MRKGISPLISFAVGTLILMTATMLVFNTGFPLIQEIQTTSSLQNAISDFKELDRSIRNIAQQGTYSQTFFRFRSRDGDVRFDNETDSLLYQLETKTSFVSSGNAIRQGNVRITSDANAEVSEGSHDGMDCYILKNDHIEACIADYGSDNSFEQANLSTSILYLRNTPSGEQIEPLTNITIDGMKAFNNGRLKTVASTGKRLGTASVDILVKPDNRPGYTLTIGLKSGTDFLFLEAQ
jgi:hypothetical protein